jgi:hypothetical protein
MQRLQDKKSYRRWPSQECRIDGRERNQKERTR